jgi:hypothetical protein
MWTAFGAWMARARRQSPSLMPWQDAREAAEVSAAGVGRTLLAMLDETPGPAEPGLHDALVSVAEAEEAAHLQRARSDKSRVCPAPGCSKRFTPSRSTQRVCSDTCRVRLHRARKAAA